MHHHTSPQQVIFALPDWNGKSWGDLNALAVISNIIGENELENAYLETKGLDRVKFQSMIHVAFWHSSYAEKE